MKSLFSLALLLSLIANVMGGEALPLPKRAPGAPTGSALLKRIELLPVPEREAAIEEEILAGNVPAFLRKFCPVEMRGTVQGREVRATILVACDYLAVGSDEDYLLTPLRPATAQRIADRLECLLPTPQMVDAIHASAPIQLPPHPLPPGPAMTTMRVMAEHSRIVRKQRPAKLPPPSLGVLTAGHKKDVVLTPRLIDLPGKVAIYGWHRLDGTAIQPLYTGHTAEWVDYSHGIRLVSQKVFVGGNPRRLSDLLADPEWSPLFSAEGPLRDARY